MEIVHNPITVSAPSVEQNIKIDESPNYQQNTTVKYKSIALIAMIILVVALPLALIAQKSTGGSSQSAQSPAQWLSENAVHIKSNSVYDSSFVDLETLKLILSGVSVVFLAENVHGVGVSSTSRARLVKFLHKELGFNTFAMERDFAYSYYAQKELQSLSPDQLGNYNLYVKPIFDKYLGPNLEDILGGIYGSGPSAPWWANSSEMKDTLWYLANNSRGSDAIDYFGFEYVADSVINTRDLQWFLNTTLTPPNRPDERYFDLWKNITSLYYQYNTFTKSSKYPPPSLEDQSYFWSTYKNTSTFLKTSGNPWGLENFDYWMQLYNSSSSYAETCFLNRSDPDIGVFSQLLRGAQMAQNIAWITRNNSAADGRPRKTIVFTAIGHSAFGINDESNIPFYPYPNQSKFWNADFCGNNVPCPKVSAGAYLRDLIGPENVYVIGATSSSGVVSPNTCGSNELQIRPVSGMLEDYLSEANFEVAAFIDFTKIEMPSWLKNNIWAFSLGFDFSLFAKVPNTMNGLLYYPEEHKCTPLL